jgi:hypothetical protein
MYRQRSTADPASRDPRNVELLTGPRVVAEVEVVEWALTRFYCGLDGQFGVPNFCRWRCPVTRLLHTYRTGLRVVGYLLTRRVARMGVRECGGAGAIVVSVIGQP